MVKYCTQFLLDCNVFWAEVMLENSKYLLVDQEYDSMIIIQPKRKQTNKCLIQISAFSSNWKSQTKL